MTRTGIAMAPDGTRSAPTAWSTAATRLPRSPILSDPGEDSAARSGRCSLPTHAGANALLLSCTCDSITDSKNHKSGIDFAPRAFVSPYLAGRVDRSPGSRVRLPGRCPAGTVGIHQVIAWSSYFLIRARCGGRVSRTCAGADFSALAEMSAASRRHGHLVPCKLLFSSE